MKKIDCFKCEHHYITYDPKFPYGCKALRFKSKRPPSEAVHDSSGSACLFFTLRKKDLVEE